MEEIKGADFSECGKYRYKLWRIWDENLPMAMCIGLNPSTASEAKNDPTIGCLSRALKKLGYGGLYMVNLFPLISSDPTALLNSTIDHKLYENDVYLAATRIKCKDVVICWGAFKQATNRIKEVLPRYPDALCFGKNSDGTPEHPMFSLVYKRNKPPLQLIKYQP